MAVNRYDFGGLLFLLGYEYDHLLRHLSRKAGLYSGQPRILTKIKDNEGCTLSDLSEITGLGMPSLSVSVRNMKKSGMIREDACGPRSRGLFLTDAGMEKAQTFHNMFDECLREYLEHIGAERADTVNFELGEMQEFFRKYRK